MMGPVQSGRTIICLLVLLWGTRVAFGQVPALTYAEEAERAYKEAASRYHAKPLDNEAAIDFGRRCFDWADFASDDDERARIANEGIAACRQVVARDSHSAGGHYYLAMDIGQLARTKSFGALKLVREMEREFLIVHDLDPKFDFAGASRNLGMLYHETPGWPTSIGNRKKARQFLEEAYKLSPDDPENGLYLIEAYLKWGDKKEAQKTFADLRNRWPGIRHSLSGERWARDWLDWEKRFSRLEAKLDDRAFTSHK